MQATVLIPIALVLFTQISLGFTEEVAAAASTNEAAGEANKASLNRVTRGAYDFMRLARGLHMLRLGKRDDASAEDSDKLEPTEPFVPEMPLDDEDEPYIAYPDEDGYVYSELDDVMPLEEGGDEEEKRSLGMLRLGKRQLSMLRLGKRQDEDLNESFNEDDKRSLGMLRLGKRQIGMLRLGKRSMSMLRLGKRPMSMLRLGKRPMSMLRLGKRPMSMLRLGKRPMSMLRLGKRPMSMLRLGKREDEDQEDKRALNMLRLGKRSTE